MKQRFFVLPRYVVAPSKIGAGCSASYESPALEIFYKKLQFILCNEWGKRKKFRTFSFCLHFEDVSQKQIGVSGKNC